jgi:glycerophosphoryl diester phosphodiesterase
MLRPIIIAHRGASGTCPENTLLAFRTALDSGAKWLELDTQLVESELVVFHDDDLERTTDGRGALADLSLAELRRLDAGMGERIPLLYEVLLLAKGRAQVNIELKGEGTGLATADLLKGLFTKGQLTAEDILVSSFLAEELDAFQGRMPEVRRAPIYEKLPTDFSAELKRIGCWSVHLDKSLISKNIVLLAEQQNCRVFAWTVNTAAEAGVLFALGTAGIFTDYPEKFLVGRD